jgi:hypothetical protein
MRRRGSGDDVRIDRRLLPPRSAKPLGLELRIDYGDGRPAVARGEAKPLALSLVNRSAAVWEGTIALSVPAGWHADGAQPVALAPGERADYAFQVRAANEAALQPAYSLAAVVSRLHDDAPWAAWQESFVLPAAAEWTVWGPDGGEGVEANFGGNRIEWEKPLGARCRRGNVSGRHHAAQPGPPQAPPRRRMRRANQGEAERRTGHCLHRTGPVHARLPPGQSGAARRIGSPCGKPSPRDHRAGRRRAAVLPVAAQETKQPGAHYYYTDILFIR